MNIYQVQRELNVINSRLRGILDEDGKRALAQAIFDIEKQMKTRRPKARKGKRSKPSPWRLEIPFGAPLRFVPTIVNQDVRHRLYLDIACQITEPLDGVPTLEHSICVRVWTDDRTLSFREAHDSDYLQSRIEEAGGRRVMLRFHFDFANAGQPGPKHHLQIGGTQQENELCWLPENLRVPRFCHHPLSLLMACEFVVKTFYPDEYIKLKLRDEASWRGAIATAQGSYLTSYYALLGFNPPTEALSVSLLERLWN